jgi:hypothetical protein
LFLLVCAGGASAAAPVLVPAGEGEGEGSNKACSTEYQVLGVVRQKLLFHQRPKPIVSRHLLGR